VPERFVTDRESGIGDDVLETSEAGEVDGGLWSGGGSRLDNDDVGDCPGATKRNAGVPAERVFILGGEGSDERHC
jgi:hypothetical protein